MGIDWFFFFNSIFYGEFFYCACNLFVFSKAYECWIFIKKNTEWPMNCFVMIIGTKRVLTEIRVDICLRLPVWKHRVTPLAWRLSMSNNLVKKNRFVLFVVWFINSFYRKLKYVGLMCHLFVYLPIHIYHLDFLLLKVFGVWKEGGANILQESWMILLIDISSVNVTRSNLSPA